MKKQPSDSIYTLLSELSPEVTAHGSGTKFVFRSNSEMVHSSTQIAYGKFEPGEVCEEHAHPTMFEYFFFLKGEGTYIIDGVSYDLVPLSFLEIPAGALHSLHANKNSGLEFVYWGIAS